MLRHHHSAELRQRSHSDDKLPPKPLEIQRPAPDIMWAPTEQLQLVKGILFKALIWIHLNPEIRLICSNRVRHIHCTYCSLTMSTLRTTNSWIHQMKIDNAHLPTLKKVEYKRMLFLQKKPHSIHSIFWRVNSFMDVRNLKFKPSVWLKIKPSLNHLVLLNINTGKRF